MGNDQRSVMKNLVPSLTSGVVIGILEVALAISFAALIFGGELAAFVPYGIGYALVGAIIGGSVIVLFTSWPGFVGGNQDVPAAILALMAVSITALMPAWATAEETFITVVVTIAITTLLTGLFFLGTGYFHLGGLVRFLPYPVIGGFLAGTGWLLVTGAVGLMTDMPADLFQLPALLQGDMILRWLPGVILAIVILIVSTRVDHYLVLPGLLLASTVLFFVIAWAGGYSLADLSEGGWLLGPFAGDGLWQAITPVVLPDVYWPAILSQAAGIATIVLVSTASLLLNAGGVELAVDQDIDLDKELRVAGVANVLSGLVAGLVGYHQLSFSVLNYKLRANNRLTGMVGVAVCVLALLAGASILALFPKIVVGALLFLLGLSFIVEWVVEGWSKMPRVEYAIVIIILLVTATVGFLEAVALGLLLAVIIFVVGYSQVDVVRHELSGATYHSRVVRSREEEQLLREHGEEVYFLQLQGFIFFGTADSLFKQVQRRVKDGGLPRLAAVVIDFGQVNGLDSTAMISFGYMKGLAETHDFALVLCAVNERTGSQLERGGLGEEETVVLYFDSADHGMAWCENRLLKRLAGGEAPLSAESEASTALFVKQIAKILRAEHIIEARKLGQKTAVEVMSSYFEKLDVDAETVLIREGEQADSLYFLARGRSTARLNMPDGGYVRLSSMGSGQVMGEIGFFLGGERTADVLADESSTLFRLTRENLLRMEEENPEAAALLHRLVANILAERAIHLTNTIRALEQ